MKKKGLIILIAFFIVVLHALLFIYLLFDENWWKKGVAGLVIIVLYSLYRLLISKTSNQRFIYGEGIFISCSMFFISAEWWWLAALEMICINFMLCFIAEKINLF
ncbi:MAG: hypothetical protein WKF59_21550 [Chitinophagaceae bacterium]